MGNLIKDKLKEQKLSVNQFAEMIKTSRTNCYNIFSRPTIKDDQLEIISNALGYNFSQHIPTDGLKKSQIRIIIDISLCDQHITDMAEMLCNYMGNLKSQSNVNINIQSEQKN